MVRSALSAVAVVALGALAVPAAAQQPTAGLLDRLEGGSWELRIRDATGVERLCIRQGRDLIQLRHPDDRCEHVIVNNDPRDVTVQYACRGRGYGRTHIWRPSERSLQIETQGIARGLPFNFTAEAQRVGACEN